MEKYIIPVVTVSLPATTPLVLGILAVILGALAVILVVTIALPLMLPSRGKTRRIHKARAIPEDCPYQYLLNIYGRYHFSGFIKKLSPTLETTNPKKWNMVCEIMDAIHFCLILVDDVTDNSDLRKGFPAAHTIFGKGETANRAYLSLVRVMNKTVREQPQLIPALLGNLEEILEGQDMSLVWRRDGLHSLPRTHEERVAAYRQSASLKTGALFRLCAQLVSEDNTHDELMTRVGWFCQLQNDCKNIYSKEYAQAKGTLAEDLRNGEFSYPIILALNDPNGDCVAKAMQGGGETDIQNAMAVLQSSAVRDVVLREMKEAGSMIQEFVEIWGRKERLDNN